MHAIRLFLAAAVYTLSVSTLIALALEPASSLGVAVELGETTVIAVEAATSVADVEAAPLLRREIS